MSEKASSELFTNCRVALCRTQVPGNIGAVARSMLNFGVHRLVLVAPECDHLEHDAVRRARSAEFILREATVHETLADALTGCSRVIGTTARQRAVDRVPLRPGQAIGETLDALGPDQEIALVFGQETSGMSNVEVDQCHEVMTVPTCDELPSLNLGSAATVALYELHQAVADRSEQGAWPPQRREEKTPERPATVEELEAMYGQMRLCLDAGNFLSKQNPDITMRYLRRFFAHANTSEFELRLWRAIWKRLNDRIRTPKPRYGPRKEWQAFLREQKRKAEEEAKADEEKNGD